MADLVVDVHVHAIPPSLNDLIAEDRFAGVSVTRNRDGERIYHFPGMEASPSAPAALDNLAAIADWGVSKGVDRQLIGPWTDLFGYTLEPRAGEGWARSYNEALAAACDADPRHEPIATIPLQHPATAVRVIEEARGLGCRGIEIGTAVPDGDFGSTAFDEVWAAAAEQRMPILLHPTFLEVPANVARHGLKNSFGRGMATAVALTQLIYAGVFERHRDLVLIAAHGGGAFVPLIDRLERSHDLGWDDSTVDIRASVGRIYWDSIVLDSAYLGYLVNKVGAGRIVLGSDHPFPWEPEPIETVHRANLPAEAAISILGRTATDLFVLEH
jgi:aminocarboxymuconate-semialdehyde decarboxylase